MEEPVSYIDEDGDTIWYLPSKGKVYYHRLDGPAMEWADGSNQWWVDDKQHRLDGPAVEWANGTKEWWVDDKRHRLDGPAVEWADGSKEWWVDDKLLSSDEVETWVDENDIDLSTDEGQMAFKLRWC